MRRDMLWDLTAIAWLMMLQAGLALILAYKVTQQPWFIPAAILTFILAFCFIIQVARYFINTSSGTRKTLPNSRRCPLNTTIRRQNRMENETPLQRLERQGDEERELPGADPLTRLRNKAILSAEAMASPGAGYDDEWAESFDDETADHARAYLKNARDAIVTIRSGTSDLPELYTALERIQESKLAAIRGENTAAGFDQEQTEAMEDHFRAAQQLAAAAASALSQVIAFLEGVKYARAG